MTPPPDTTATPTPIPAPRPWGTNRRRLLREGAPLTPLQRLKVFSDEEFENFVYEWAHEYLSTKYSEVQLRRGPGDKGRDVIGWIDSAGGSTRHWDNYQCKHYASPLTPTEVWVEIGKLCYYVSTGDFTLPTKYVFVSPQGAGPKLQSFFDDPGTLRDEFKKAWPTYCAGKITTTRTIPMEGALAALVDQLDFGIFSAMDPQTMIDQHATTRYHALVFGAGIDKVPRPLLPPPDLDPMETRYVEQFLEAASEEVGTTVLHPAQLTPYSRVAENFRHTRECFYEAESLKEFARDSFPDEADFIQLKDDVYGGIRTTVLDSHANGYRRLMRTTEVAVGIQLDRNALIDFLSPKHRVGVVHHLANEDRIIWVERR